MLIFCRRIAYFFISIVFITVCCGCNLFRNDFETVSISVTEDRNASYVVYKPTAKPDGSKFRVAYVDIDPYPVTGQILYYLVSSLIDDGWIILDGDLPFDGENTDAKQLISWLAARDLGPYIEFSDDANYYIAQPPAGVTDSNLDGIEYTRESLSEHVNVKNDIDLIITNGTSPSKEVMQLGFDIPHIIIGVVNPVGSGLVKSFYYSGYKNIWASTHPSSFEKQMNYYYDTFRFDKLGVIYYNEVVASMDEYRSSAKTNGFECVERVVDESLYGTEKYYNDIDSYLNELIYDENIDAFLFSTGLLTETKDIKRVINTLNANKIPSFVQLGANYVEAGGLLLVQFVDYRAISPFLSYTVGAVLNGVEPGSLPQENATSPYLVMNLDTANAIGFNPSFEIFLSCERIYSSQNESDYGLSVE